MWINPFWAGVGATIIVEVAVIVIAAVIDSTRRK